MIHLQPTVLEGNGVRLEPLSMAHAHDLRQAASDGKLWELWFTTVPEPDQVEAYIEAALKGQEAGTMLAWVVRELESGRIIGSTRYHDVIANVGRVEIGYTWYAKSWQGTFVNPACKLLLFGHAFDTLGCKVVGLRTDDFNHRSQAAIEKLGAKKDGVIRHHFLRRDGTVRNTHMYSVVASEWPEVKAGLEARLAQLTR